MHNEPNHTDLAQGKRGILVDEHGNPVDLVRLASRLFHIANVLDVTARAMPYDRHGEVPARCLVTELATMTEAVATEVSEYVIADDVDQGGADHA